MTRTLLTGTILRSGSIPTSALGGGVVSSSAQTVAHLENQVINVGAISASGHIVPTENEVYDLGSATKQFRDLYLSGSTIYLGGLKLTEENGGLAVKRTRRINDAIHDDPVAGVAPLSGSFTGSFYGNGTDIVGVQYTNLTQVPANIVSQSSQVILNSTTGTLEVNKGGTGHTTYTNGQLLIGNTESTTLTKTTLTAGEGIIVTNGAGTITIAATSTGAVTSVSGTGTVSGLTLSGTVTSSGNLTLGGALSLTTEQVTSALGYTPYNVSNPAGYTTNTGTVTSVATTGTVSGLTLTGGTITTAGTITLGGTLSVTSENVTTALGYTPYNATNPNGYTTNTGTVTSVAGTGTASGLTLSGTVTTSGNLTLSGTVNSLAAGTYAISISGNASTATSATTATTATSATTAGSITSQANSATITATTAETADRIVLRNSNGDDFRRYGFASYFNMSHGVSGATTDTVFYSSTDDYIRKNNATGFRASLNVPTRTGGDASGTWGISISGNAATVSGLTLNSSANGINPDNVTQNQIGYNTSVSLFGQTDGGLYSSAYNSSWIHQIFGDFRSGQIAIRGKNNGTWQAWRTVLDSSNYSSYALPLTGGTITGTTYFRSNMGNGVYSGNTNSPPLQVFSTDGGTSMMSFHRSGAYAVNMGLDPDNVLRIGGWSASANRWELDMSGNNWVAGSSRAPIFYDSNNTGYYTDPASTSVVNVLQFGTSTNSGRFDGSGTWGVHFRTNSGYINFGPANGGHAHIYTDRPDFYFNAPLTVNGGSIINTSDIRATIFYDSNNTAYYCDPNGTARLSYVVANGGIRIDGNENLYLDNNYGQSIVGVYTSTRYQGVFAMGNSYKLPIDGSSTGSLYGLAWSHPNAGGVAGNLNTHGLLAMENGTWLASLTGSTRARDDMRAPLFYDNNNTGYYCDPASTTNLNALLAYSVQGNGNVGGTGSASWHPSGIYSGSTQWFYGAMYRNGAGTYNGGEAHYTIMYDNNNTGFYLDPNSTSVLAQLNVNNRIFIGEGNVGDPGNTTPQVFHKSGGGLGLSGIEIDCWTGFGGQSYPNNFQIGFRMSYDKRLYVWQDLVQYYSDERLKNKTGFLDGALDAIKNWTPFKYVDNDIAAGAEYTNRRPQIGLSAQEVQQYYPELVELAPFDMETDLSDPSNIRKYSKSGQNYLTLNYPRLIPVLIQAIKEQQAKIEELESRINNS